MHIEVTEGRGNGPIFRSLRRAAKHGLGGVEGGMKRFAGKFQRRYVKEFLTGRPGLNRVTGRAARSGRRRVVRAGNTVTARIWFNAPYIVYHADTYTPKGQPRRFPIRVHGALLFHSMTDPEEIGEAFWPTSTRVIWNR